MAFTYKHGDKPLEGYVIQRAVGKGGFGEVYYALSEGGKEVALKYLRDNPQIELRGVSHCMNLKSPHLVTVYDVRQNADGEYFIVMEYVHGPSLRDLLVAEPNGLGTQKAAFFVSEIAKGLSYLHERGIIHRDMKPGNIFYEDGYVKIGDYGLSKFISMSRHSGQTASVGTVHYMAPEVGSGNYHRGIDIYALGVMLYEMLLGKVPFEGSSMGEVLMKHLTEQPEVDELAAPFTSVIRKALLKDPKERYQTVDEMAQDILEAEEIRRSVADFKPESMASVARRIMETQVMDSPHPSPHGGAGFPKIKPRPHDDAALDARAFSDRIAERMEAVGGPVPRRARRMGGDSQPAESYPVQTGLPMSRATRLQSLLVSTIVALGLSVGIALLTGAERTLPAHVGISFAFILALRVGIGFAGKVFERMAAPSDSAWANKLITLGCCTIPILIVGSITQEEMGGVWRSAWGASPRDLMFALLATSLFVDWSRRVRHGLQGRVEFKDAFMAGLFGLCAGAAISGGEEIVTIMSAGVAAATSLTIQSAALFRRPAPGQTLAVGGPYASDAAEPAEKKDSDRHRVQFAGGMGPATAAGQAAAAAAAAGEIGNATLRDIDSAVGHMHEDRYADPRSAFLQPDRKPRPVFFRVFWGIMSAALITGAGVCGLGTGLIAHADEEVMGFLIGAASCVLMSIFTLLKTTAYKRTGFWNDTLRPFLACAFFCGAAACALVIGFLPLDDEELFGTLCGLIATSVFGLICTFIGGRRNRVATLERPGHRFRPVLAFFFALVIGGAILMTVPVSRRAPIPFPPPMIPGKLRALTNGAVSASMANSGDWRPVSGSGDILYKWQPKLDGKDLEVTVRSKVPNLDAQFLYTLRLGKKILDQQEMWHELWPGKDHVHTWHVGEKTKGAELDVEYVGRFQD